MKEDFVEVPEICTEEWGVFPDITKILMVLFGMCLDCR
jgi:hypothetical protein